MVAGAQMGETLSAGVGMGRVIAVVPCPTACVVPASTSEGAGEGGVVLVSTAARELDMHARAQKDAGTRWYRRAITAQGTNERDAGRACIGEGAIVGAGAGAPNAHKRTMRRLTRPREHAGPTPTCNVHFILKYPCTAYPAAARPCTTGLTTRASAARTASLAASREYAAWYPAVCSS